MSDLTTLLASHRAKAEAAPKDWDFSMRGVVDGEYSFVDTDSASSVAHIDANDPATVLALLDVVEAASEIDTWDWDADQHIDGGTLNAALDRLKEVLR